ncbi:MAG: response regulator transcription factor [Pseudanabaenaceae cyanobacterium]
MTCPQSVPGILIRLLLIDDEVELTKPLQAFLQQQGYFVTIAQSGEEGWQLWQREKFHLVILDWLMPGLSGLDLCRRLRQVDPTVPILFLTAKDTLDDRVLGLEMGADDYLVKPFELRELLARVRALLRRVNYPPALSYGNLSLDRDNSLCRRGGRVIHLSDKELQLLHFFLQNPHRVISHRELIHHLWGEENSPNSNALVAQIKLLRRKIDIPPDPPLIHTVYGKGYWFGQKN